MKASKHSRQHSESDTTSRRRENQNRNSLVQSQTYHHRMANPSYYPAPASVPVTEQDVYEAYRASTAIISDFQQYQQQESSVRRSNPNHATWDVRDGQYQAQQQQQQQQRQQEELQQLSEPKSLLNIKHRPSSGAWSMRDDQQLLAARMEGLNWNKVQQKYFPNKSSNACRKRHERLIDTRGRGDGETERLERIAAEYVSMREALWRPLASKTGEKWTYVEKQCLASGLKNLQGIARAVSRRQRCDSNAMAAAAAVCGGGGYDDDSGISGTGLTPVEEIEAAAAYSSSSAAPSPNTTAAAAASAAQSFASSTTVTATSYLQQQHSHHLAHAHLHPAAVGAYAGLMYGAGAQYQHPQHAYSSSISSNGSLHPGYVTRRGDEGA